MITVDNVKQTTVELGDYCVLSKKHDFLSVIDWRNGEGKTVQVCAEGVGLQTLDLTYGQYEALQVAWNYKEEKQK